MAHLRRRLASGRDEVVGIVVVSIIVFLPDYYKLPKNRHNNPVKLINVEILWWYPAPNDSTY